MYRSLWQETAGLPQFPTLCGNLTTDVLVIGGGMAGLLCLWHLRQAGISCALVEAETICSGVTGHTTAKVTAQHGLVYHKIAKRYGLERAGLYLEANERAVARYATLCSDMDCGWEQRPSYVYTADAPQAMAQELAVLKQLGYPAKRYTGLALPVSATEAIRFDGQGQFHPLRFAAAIAEGLPIYEHTKVRRILPQKVITDHGTITAGDTIVATHFPILNRCGGYFMKQYQYRSYVLALEGVPRLNGMYLEAKPNGLSFRSYDNLLLLGGGGHRTGAKGGGWSVVTEFAQCHWPQSRTVGRWATQDCITLDDLPYVGRYARSVPHLYVATGFGKWGMTNAMTAGALLTDLVRGKSNPYEKLYSPMRSMLHPRIALNGLHAVGDLLRPTVPRCPHMGCALRYNRAEHTWDCPCHGSRFSRGGDLLDGPANEDLQL